MKLSTYFLPTLKEAPREAEIVSHRLMLRAGMIRQENAGIYSWLPLGLKVLNKVCDVVREEQNRAGAHEILMPTLQPADLWRESGRYEAYGKEMLRIKDRHERDMLYGPTNEEMVTAIFRTYVQSYRALPLNLYHIQLKFRDEIRPRFGVMRGREFLMKDAYSFDLDEASARQAYYRMFMAYLRTFNRFGVKAIPMAADTGPIGGDLSHEFIILADTGESKVYCDGRLFDTPVPDENMNFSADLEPLFRSWTAPYAVTDEKYSEAEFNANVPQAHRRIGRGIEVGHIFYFGTKYSEPMGACVTDEQGVERPVHMGSYGIGPSRLVAALIEASHDEAGIIWPAAASPFDIVLLNLKTDDKGLSDTCFGLYNQLKAAGFDVLYDDTPERAGQKFARADLIGVPLRLALGPRGLADGMVELKFRQSNKLETVPIDNVVDQLLALKSV